MKGSTLGWILGAVVAGILTVIGGLAALLYFGMKGVSERAPTESEQRLVLTSARFGEHGIDSIDPKFETIRWRRNIDGTQSVEYEYDSDKNPHAKAILYVNSEAEINRTERDARQSFTLSVAAMKGGLAIGGGETTLTAVPALLTVGQQRYAAQMKNGDEIVGNLFVARQGRVLHSLIIAGVYLDDPQVVRQMLEPLLQESERQFGPGKR